MRDLIEEVKDLDLSQTIEYLDKINRIKREILAKSFELYEIRQNYLTYLEHILTRKKADKGEKT